MVGISALCPVVAPGCHEVLDSHSAALLSGCQLFRHGSAALEHPHLCGQMLLG